MHSVGRTTEPGEPARGAVAQAEPVAVPMAAMGNRALAAMARAATPPIVVAKPASASLALDDPGFNPTTRAHDLLRAVDSEQYTFAVKNSGGPFGGMVEDVESERRKIDFPAVVTALDGLTASQVKKVEEVFFEFEKRTTLRDDLFGKGQSGRAADLTKDQIARIEALLGGTKAEPIPLEVMEELRKYPPEIAGPLKADLETRADAGPALNRHKAEAAELHQLLAGELDEAKRERVMAMHRRPAPEIDALDACYAGQYGPAALTYDLNLRLQGLQLMRMTELRAGNFAQADACAIEDKRRRIEELNKQDVSLGGIPVGYDFVLEQRRKEKQKLTGDIQAIIELNKREALADAANSGRSAGQAVAERLRTILDQQDGEAGTTLGGALGRTLAKEDAAVLAAATDPWNATNTSNLVRAAAAQLAADERAGTTSAKKVIETLKGFRELAQHDLTAQAYDPRVPAEQKLALQRDGESAVTRLAQQYAEEYKAEYTKLAGENGRGYDEIMHSADDADETYIKDLSYGGGRTSDLGELEHAMGKKDIDAVKGLLRKQPSREKVDELVAAYDKLGDGRDLRRELFGADQLGRTATPELAQLGSSMFVSGGLVSGRDAAQVAEQLTKPGAAGMKGEDEARWIVKGGLTEYGVTMDHRGLTGMAREIGDDPETERLLERTKNDLATLGKQFEAETDPVERERLVAEMRRLRATLTGDADAYEKDNERVLGDIRSALSFAVSIALAVLIPGAGPGIVAFLQTTAVNIAANVAANFVIKMGDYSLADLKADVLGGALGAGGAKFGEELMGRVAAAVMRPAAEATAETAGKLGVKTALAHEVGALAGAGEKTVIAAAEFEITTVGQVAGKSIVETGAREVGGFLGGIYGPKFMTGDFGLSVDEVLKALAATAAGKVAHRTKGGATEEQVKPAEEQVKPAEEEVAPKPAEETTAALPVAGEFVPEPAPPASDAFGKRSTQEMLLDSGIPPASAKGFQDIADVFNVVLKVRPTNTASLPVLEAGGVAKPELIKAKTVNRVDQLIGAPPDGLGKVGFFEPRLPSEPILQALKPEARTAVQERYQQRLEEYNHYKQEYGELAEQGLLKMTGGVLQIVDPRTGEFRDIGGDHDIFEITNSDGTPLHPDVRRALVNQMRAMGINVEHPDHVSWPVDSPKTFDDKAYQKIVDQHTSGEALVAFVPKSQPRPVMAGETVTGPPRAEGVGDRFLPAAGGQVTEPGPAGPTRAGETDFSVEPRHATADEIAGAREAGPGNATTDEIAGARERDPAAMRPAGARNRSAGGAPDVLNTRIAGQLLEVRAEWPNLTRQARAERLVLAVALEVQNTGCPFPKVRIIGGENSYFHPDSWLIDLGRPAMAVENPSAAQFAEICDHVRHEWEHAILEFRVARREARLTGESIQDLADRLGMDPGAAQRAVEANATPGRFEAIDGTPLDFQARLINESLRGSGERDRRNVHHQLTATEKALARAQKMAGPAGQVALENAQRLYDRAHDRYMRLPDEMFAWDAGRQVQEIVRKHHDLAADMAAARKELVAHDAALEEALAAGQAGTALDRLQTAVDRAEEHLDQLVSALARRTGR